MFFFRKRRQNAPEEEHNDASFVEVVEMRRRLHQTTAQAKKEIDKVNSTFRANGITLKIHIASGGHHGR